MSVVSNSVRPHRRQPARLPHPWDSPGKNTGVGFHFLLQCMKVKSESEITQSCPTLSDPMDCSLPGSSIHGTFQARVLDWGAIAFSVKGLYNPLKWNFAMLSFPLKNIFLSSSYYKGTEYIKFKLQRKPRDTEFLWSLSHILSWSFMTKLDSILKSRGIALPTKVHLVKAMVFPVIMYGCELNYEEGWAPKNWCFWAVVLEKALDSPVDCKEIQPVHSEGDQPWDLWKEWC